MLLSFAGLIALGTVALALPAASATGEAVPLVDALFTSTSAVCVTGLITVDTASRWSGFGLGTILVLIQLGALGLITFATLIALLLGKRLTLSQREIFAGVASPLRRIDLYRIVRRIVLLALGIELLGWLALWGAFARHMDGGEAAWHALFHSVSAFCNAGFSTFSDSLMAYRADAWVTGVVMALVVLGGLGFVVLMDLENRWRYRDRVGLHTRIALGTTGLLIAVGAAGFYLCERGNTLAGLGPAEQALAALFGSVTARTAGFNTVDYGAVTAPCLLLTMFLMFVGGCPGSCAGGLKTTTFAVVLAAARSALAGHPGVHLFRRSVPEGTVRQALVLALLALSAASVLPLGLVITEGGATPYHEAAGRYLELCFETVSALGTVGLSTGVTPNLSPAGKLQVVVMMYVGRLGLLTLGLALARRATARYRYAEESVIVG